MADREIYIIKIAALFKLQLDWISSGRESFTKNAAFNLLDQSTRDLLALAKK